MFISVCFCINIFSDVFLSSNFYYTSIISIRTKSGRIHLNKTNFAAIIEKTREMFFLFVFFSRILQCDTLQISSDLDRVRIPDTVPAVTGTTCTEKSFPKNVFIFYLFFLVSPFTPRLNCTFNIKTKNVQTENILTKHPVCRSLYFFSLAFVFC